MIIEAQVMDTLLSEVEMGEKKELRVCGVFSSAVYLRDDTMNVYLIHDRKYGLLPFGIGIAECSTLLLDKKVVVGEG